MPTLISEQKRILIIGSNHLNNKLYSIILGKLAAQIEIVTSDIDAIERINEIQPDIIAIEINFPPSSSAQFIQKIRMIKNFENIPIIALSPCVMRGDEDLLLSSGCSAFIPVPIDTRAFYRFFEQTLA